MKEQNFSNNDPNNINRRNFIRQSGMIAASALWAPALMAEGISHSPAPGPNAPIIKVALMTYTFARQGWKNDNNFDLVGMCKVGQELGIDGVDIVSHSFSPLDPALIRRILDDYGQKVVCYTFFPPLCKLTTEERAAGIDEVKKALDIAHILGTDKIMIHTPGKSEFSRDVCRTNWIHGLQEAIELSRAAGITLAIESIPGSPLATSDEMLQAIRAVPGLKLVYDNGNVYTSGEDPVVFFKACQDHIIHAHFKDGSWVEDAGKEGTTNRRYSNELIGEGNINQFECLQAMKQAGYSGYIDIEYESNKYPPDIATRKAFEYINNQLMLLK